MKLEETTNYLDVNKYVNTLEEDEHLEIEISIFMEVVQYYKVCNTTLDFLLLATTLYNPKEPIFTNDWGFIERCRFF